MRRADTSTYLQPLEVTGVEMIALRVCPVGSTGFPPDTCPTPLGFHPRPAIEWSASFPMGPLYWRLRKTSYQKTLWGTGSLSYVPLKGWWDWSGGIIMQYCFVAVDDWSSKNKSWKDPLQNNRKESWIHKKSAWVTSPWTILAFHPTVRDKAAFSELLISCNLYFVCELPMRTYAFWGVGQLLGNVHLRI